MAESVPLPFSSVSIPKTTTKKGNVQVTLLIPKEQVEFLTQLSAMLGVRKGAVVMLAISMLMKHYTKNELLYKEIAKSPKRRAEVRRLFANYGCTLGDRDFIF